MPLVSWWDWFERNGITTALMISDTTKLMMSRFLLIMSVLCSSKNTTEVYQKVSYGIQPAKIIQLVACGKFT